MVVVLHLSGTRPANPDDQWGRTVVGWDPSLTDEELWSLNRGIWSLGARADNETLAALVYDGVVRVVAELDGDRELVRKGRTTKYALVGTVLEAGDARRDSLVGTTVTPVRNPVGYIDDPVIGEHDDGPVHPHEPRAFLLTYNPDAFGHDDESWREGIAATALRRHYQGQWATGNRTGGITPRDRVFLLRQGRRDRGLVGSGFATSHIFQEPHWDPDRSDEGDVANYVMLTWDSLLALPDALPVEQLRALAPEQDWAPAAGGIVLRANVVADVEKAWAAHLEQLGREAGPPRSTPRGTTMGWQHDPERRRKVENEAQRRLEQHYRDLDWDVRDVRYERKGCDAVAVKDGVTLFLEAKGTETAGDAIIVTSNEVATARMNPSHYVLGVLSNIRFRPDGEVDPEAGTFQLTDPWDPDAGTLTAIEYRWSQAPAD